jgi:hypothetical protein
MAASENFRNSEYLIGYYIEAAGAMRDFEHWDDEGNQSRAREALHKGAAIICKALQRLAEDQTFWDSLAALREPIEKSQPAIRQTLDEIHLFIAAEETVFLEHKLPPAIVRRLLSDTMLTLKTFRADSDTRHVAALKDGILEARNYICELSNEPTENEPRHRFFAISQTTKEALGVLGGAVTIVVNAVSATAANPLALASIVGGASASLGFLEWIRRGRRGRD